VLAVNEGSIKLDENLALSNFLHVPCLTCNLISVSQIVDEINCVAVFSKHMCALQDCTSKMLIGVGEHQDGLYYFQKKPGVKVRKVTGVDSLDLWHARLGHHSLKVIKLVPALDVRKGNDLLNKHCHICYQAKHKRDSFPLSDNKASDLFELIHCDLWGPYRTAASCGAYYF